MSWTVLRGAMPFKQLSTTGYSKQLYVNSALQSMSRPHYRLKESITKGESIRDFFGSVSELGVVVVNVPTLFPCS